MEISVIGLGYVGLGVASSFLSLGHRVIALDKDEEKINLLRKETLPINEPEILDVLIKNRWKIVYTSDYREINNSKVIFVCINTPDNPDWSVNTSMIDEGIKSVIEHASKDSLIIIKSTVPVGYTSSVKELIEDKGLEVAFVPEFLRQGFAYHDSMNPTRLVFGVESEKARKIIEELYKPFNVKKVFTNFASAELAKYASNNFLATKITFINQVANFANAVGADINDVRDIMELDPRIGKGSLNPGVGFGGGCFVKDTKALYHQSNEKGRPITISKEVIDENERQKYILLNALSDLYNGLENLKDTKILFVGISFKGNSSDLRNSIAVDNLRVLSRFTNNIEIYDKDIKSDVLGFKVSGDLEKLVAKNDVIMIFTEKNEINDIPNSLFKNKIVLDGRNVVEKSKICDMCYYFSIGRGTIDKR